MIVTRLLGGLGNQMFQYAAGRVLAQRRGVPLAIDRRAFGDYRTHAFGMDCFMAELVDAPESRLPTPAGKGRLQRWMRRLSGPVTVYAERDFTWDPKLSALPDGTYLDGYWQSEKYFADYAETIRHDFGIRHRPSAENAAWLQRIQDSHAVSLHIRRGDYVSDPAANALHGTCGPDYYQRAVDIVQRRTGRAPELFVFSDDPDWAAANLKLPFRMHLIRNNDAATNYEDLRLMSACRHHIIANSSFSWWGAWLDPRPDTVVVAPMRWFAGGKPDARDLVPERWVKA